MCLDVSLHDKMYNALHFLTCLTNHPPVHSAFNQSIHAPQLIQIIAFKESFCATITLVRYTQVVTFTFFQVNKEILYLL